MQQIIDTFFVFVAKQRNTIVLAFQIISWGLVCISCLAIWSTVKNDGNAIFFYGLAREFGEYAAFSFILTSIPGIARRFRYNHKLIMILMMFRRQIGILMYLFVLFHAVVLRFIPWMTKQIPITPEVFVMAGSLSSMALFFVFVTSNDWSVKTLGIWWEKIHHLVYFIVWGIFLHLALASIGKWTILIGATAIAQLVSHIYASRHR